MRHFILYCGCGLALSVVIAITLATVDQHSTVLNDSSFSLVEETVLPNGWLLQYESALGRVRSTITHEPSMTGLPTMPGPHVIGDAARSFTRLPQIPASDDPTSTIVYVVAKRAYGWPAVGLWYIEHSSAPLTYEYESGDGLFLTPYGAVPYYVSARGLLVNILLSAVVLWCGRSIYMWMRGQGRRCRMRCPECTYRLLSFESGCPECGWNRTEDDS